MEPNSTSTVVVNTRHLTNPIGIFRVLEVLFGLLCWALVAEFSCCHPAFKFVMFATVTPWIVSLGLLVLYLCFLHSTKMSNWPWTIIEFSFNGFWGVIYLVAACVLAAYAYWSNQLIAATVFGFFTAAIYIFHGLTAFMEYRGTPFGSSKSDGMEVST